MKEMLNQAKNRPPKNTQQIPISQNQIMEKMGRMVWDEMNKEIQLLGKINELEQQKAKLEQQLNQEVKP
jgi:hypothetical protein